MQTQLTFLQEDSLANHSQWQDKEKGQMTNAIYGAKCLEQFKRLNPHTSLQKTSLVSRILMGEWYSSRCALTWKMKGTKFNRLLFQLQPKTHRTEEIEFGLLPTPTAMMDEATIEKVDARNQKQMEKGNSPFILGLAQQAMRGMLPTPCTRDYKGDRTLTNGKNITMKGEEMNLTLEQAARIMGGVQNNSSKNSQLNPQFVAEMMGFPTDWTELPFLNGEQNQSKDTATQ